MFKDLTSEEVNNVISKLSYFNPSYNDLNGNSIIEYLVLITLSNYPLLKVNSLQIQTDIKKLFHVAFAEEEINFTGARLSAKGLIYFEESKRSKQAIFQIQPNTAQKINSNISEYLAVERQILDEWRDEILKNYQEYDIIRNNIDNIEYALKMFCASMLNRHGIESIALLYPEKETTKKWIDSIQGSIIDDLPKYDSFVDAIIKLEIPRFFKKSDPKRLSYVTGMLNSTFMWHLVQVDKDCEKVLRKITRGQKLFIDNNIIYSLVGFHGESQLKAAATMIKMAHTLNYEIWVTTKTVDEYHGSLLWRLKEQKQKIPVPADLARVALSNIDDSSFIALYWKEFVANGSSIDDFVAKKQYIEDILKGLNIKITDEYRRDLDDSDEHHKYIEKLMESTGGGLGKHVADHDAYHALFIDKLRKTPKYNYLEAEYWFLTQDSKLPAYGRYIQGNLNYLPFCISTDQWVQINRPLLSRTSDEDELDRSYQALVTLPYLRAMITSLPLENTYNEVMSRLAGFKNLRPELALKVVTDRHFMISLTNNYEPSQIGEKIESHFINYSEELKIILQKTKDENVKLEKESQDLKDRLLMIEKANFEQQKGIKEIQTSLLNTTSKLEEFKQRAFDNQAELELQKTENTDIKEKLGSTEKRYATLRKSTMCISYCLILLVISFIIWYHDIYIKWPLIDDHPKLQYIQLTTQILLFPSLLAIFNRKHWIVWLSISVTLLVLLIKLIAL